MKFKNRISETRSWLFEKIEIDKPLDKVFKKKKKMQITKVRNKSGDIANFTEI